MYVHISSYIQKAPVTSLDSILIGGLAQCKVVPLFLHFPALAALTHLGFIATYHPSVPIPTHRVQFSRNALISAVHHWKLSISSHHWSQFWDHAFQPVSSP